VADEEQWSAISTLATDSLPQSMLTASAAGNTLTAAYFLESGEPSSSLDPLEILSAHLTPPDSDGDGVPNYEDNCPLLSNPGQLNTDALPIDNGPVVAGDDLTNPYGDALGDACDPDDDNDWLSDADEAARGTNRLIRDTDGDLVLDGAEVLLGSNPLSAASKPSSRPPGDKDGDGLPASVEAILGSSDSKFDSDGDGINDGLEVKGWGTSPSLKDTDGDGCADNVEIADVNGDGVVGLMDVLIVAERAARIKDDDFDRDPPWNFSPAFDLTKDGRIDLLDVALVAVNLGKKCGR
jgi:hypothetical protein